MVNPRNDHDKLSARSKQIADLEELIRNAPEVNKARVEFLKGEVANGRYQMSSAKIAAKMIIDIEMS